MRPLKDLRPSGSPLQADGRGLLFACARAATARGTCPREAVRPFFGPAHLGQADHGVKRGVTRRRRVEAGFTLVETLVGGAVLSLALLGHAASVATTHVMNGSIEERGIALQAVGRLLERLRADPDWSGLYARLRPLSTESAADAGLSRLDVDLSLATHPVASYYPDLEMPASLGTVTVLVQVPSKTVDSVSALREDLVAPRYGLPYDLSGDGGIDGLPRDDDYRMLPVVVRLRWRHPPKAAQEVVVSTWLRGER